MTLLTSTLRRLPVVAAITFAVSLSSATVQAQQPVAQSSGGSESFSQADQQMAELQMRINKLSTTLKLIQQKLLAENAELEGQRKVYIAMVDKAVADQGIDANMVRQRLMWISKQTQKGELPQDQMAALSQEFQEKVRQLNQAEMKAMQAPSIMQAQQALNKAMIDGMTAADPTTPEMIFQLQSAQRQYQQLMSASMQQQLKQQLTPEK